MDRENDTRGTYSVEIWSSARKALDEVCDRTGISKKRVLGRMIEWFVKQPIDLQVVILGQLPDWSAVKLLRLVAEEIESEGLHSSADQTGPRDALRDRGGH